MPTLSSYDTNRIVTELALASAEVNRLRRELLLICNTLELTRTILSSQQGEELLLTPDKLDFHLSIVHNQKVDIPEVNTTIPSYTHSQHAIIYDTTISIL